MKDSMEFMKNDIFHKDIYLFLWRKCKTALNKNVYRSVTEWIRVVAFETVKLRDEEGVGSIPGLGQVGGE